MKAATRATWERIIRDYMRYYAALQANKWQDISDPVLDEIAQYADTGTPRDKALAAQLQEDTAYIAATEEGDIVTMAWALPQPNGFDLSEIIIL